MLFRGSSIQVHRCAEGEEENLSSQPLPPMSLPFATLLMSPLTRVHNTHAHHTLTHMHINTTHLHINTTHLHTHAHAYMYTHAHTHMTHAYTYMYTHAHTHMTHAHHTLTHTHTPIFSPSIRSTLALSISSAMVQMESSSAQEVLMARL